MSMQVFPTAPSPTVTHLMNRDTLDAIAKAQGGRKKWAEVGRAENKRQGEELVLLLFGVVVAHWLLVEEEGSKRDREGSHAFLSQVPLTGSHSCLRGHLFPSLFIWLSWCCFCFRQWPTGIWILFSPSQNGVYYPGTENCMSYLTLRSSMLFGHLMFGHLMVWFWNSWCLVSWWSACNSDFSVCSSLGQFGTQWFSKILQRNYCKYLRSFINSQHARNS